MAEPGNARPWTEQTYEIYPRLDARDPVQREIMLGRLETQRGDLPITLLPQFCAWGRRRRTTPSAGCWLYGTPRARKRRQAQRRQAADGPCDALFHPRADGARRQQAGKVEQRYYGPTFLGIWDEVTPDSHAELCAGSINDISNHFRKR